MFVCLFPCVFVEERDGGENVVSFVLDDFLVFVVRQQQEHLSSSHHPPVLRALLNTDPHHGEWRSERAKRGVPEDRSSWGGPTVWIHRYRQGIYNV